MNLKRVILQTEQVIKAQGTKIRNGANVTVDDVDTYQRLISAYRNLLPVEDLVQSQKRLEAIIGKVANVDPNHV